jgi:hypothetical protein
MSSVLVSSDRVCGGVNVRVDCGDEDAVKYVHLSSPSLCQFAEGRAKKGSVFTQNGAVYSENGSVLGAKRCGFGTKPHAKKKGGHITRLPYLNSLKTTLRLQHLLQATKHS